jgi:vacuolar-type H+-ATPase subunit E/Vma4
MQIPNILHATVALLALQRSIAIKAPGGNGFLNKGVKNEPAEGGEGALKKNAFKWPVLGIPKILPESFKIPVFIQDSLKNPLVVTAMVATVLFKPVLSPAINNLRAFIDKYREELKEKLEELERKKYLSDSAWVNLVLALVEQSDDFLEVKRFLVNSEPLIASVLRNSKEKKIFDELLPKAKNLFKVKKIWHEFNAFRSDPEDLDYIEDHPVSKKIDRYNKLVKAVEDCIVTKEGVREFNSDFFKLLNNYFYTVLVYYSKLGMGDIESDWWRYLNEKNPYTRVADKLNEWSQIYANTLGLGDEWKGDRVIKELVSEILQIAKEDTFCATRHEIEDINNLARDILVNEYQKISYQGPIVENVKKCLEDERCSKIKNALSLMIKKYEKAQNLPKATDLSGGFMCDDSLLLECKAVGSADKNDHGTHYQDQV